jgi:ADP-ribose pyrophosphatase YjhB (NUDIX family)
MPPSVPRVGCGAAIVVADRILLVKRLTDPEAGCWGLPGGKIDLYETTMAAVEREIKEELGIEIRAVDLLCVVNHIDPGKGLHWVSTVYGVTSFEGVPKLLETEKHAAFEWFQLNALPDALTCATAVALQAWRKR